MNYALLPVLLILLVILVVVGINVLWHSFINHQVSGSRTLYGEAQAKSLQEYVDRAHVASATRFTEPQMKSVKEYIDSVGPVRCQTGRKLDV